MEFWVALWVALLLARPRHWFHFCPPWGPVPFMVAGALGAFSAPGSQARSPSGPHRLHFCLGSGRFGVALLLAPLLPPVLWSLGPLFGLWLLLLPWVAPGRALAIGTN